MGLLCGRARAARPKEAIPSRTRRPPIRRAPSTSARITPGTGPISSSASATTAMSISYRFSCDWPRNASGKPSTTTSSFSFSLSLLFLLFFLFSLSLSLFLSGNKHNTHTRTHTHRRINSNRGIPLFPSKTRNNKTTPRNSSFHPLSFSLVISPFPLSPPLPHRSFKTSLPFIWN